MRRTANRKPLQDVPEVFDGALADFAAELEPPPGKTGAGR
jgi:hypothetical protein